MDKRPDIWRHLQDHETTPPGELSDRLFEFIHTNGHRQLKEEKEKELLQRLQRFVTPPPPPLWKAIQESLNLQKKTRAPIRFPFIGSRKKKALYGIAASLVLVVTSILIDQNGKKPDHPAIAASKPAPAAPAAPAAAPVVVIPDTTSTSQNAGADSALACTNIDFDSTAPARTLQNNITLHLPIDGHSLSLVDNDLLVTFTSFHYPQMGDYINHINSDQDWKIRLDQFTSILISPQMTESLKGIYETRSNGKPTRRARKTLERFEKWKTDDEKRFDRTPFCNPADPIDLGEFISGRSFTASSAQDAPAAPRSPVSTNDLTVSYSISVISKRKPTDIGMTYDGGIQTLFSGRHATRLRLVSLMRIQSLFSSVDNGRLNQVTIIKESGRNKQRTTLNPSQWALYNKKYNGLTCQFTEDTALLLKHICKKAIITLRDGREITAWYAPSIPQPLGANLEPAFGVIPGLVLKYEYTYKRKTIRYTATAISRSPIHEDVLAIPAN